MTFNFGANETTPIVSGQQFMDQNDSSSSIQK